jgi:anti-sigma regulatory factor (Ser/Thr protein kinase)
VCPEIQLLGAQDLRFTYIPSHLHYILFEIVKNSLRAVVEHYGPNAPSFPPIQIIMAEGDEDISIKIADQGGGMLFFFFNINEILNSYYRYSQKWNEENMDLWYVSFLFHLKNLFKHTVVWNF